MATETQQTTSQQEDVRTQRQVFDLNTMQSVTLHKITPFAPVVGPLQEAIKEALARLGSDDKVIYALNEGLIADLRRSAVNDVKIPWMEEVEEGKFEEYKGQPVTPEGQMLLNQLVLTLAKTMFQYPADIDEKRLTREQVFEARKARTTAKDKALQFIKEHKELLNGIRETA